MPTLAHSLEATLLKLCHIHGRVEAWRDQAEKFLLTSVAILPLSTDGTSSKKEGDWHAAAFKLQRLSCMMPTAGLQDLLCMALDPQLLPRNFNPFFSAASKASFHRALLLWLQLCVLEDRLGRLKAHAQAGREAQLVQELQVCL
jgi:hypothetical protein